MERRSALCTAEMLNQQSHWYADSLPTKIYKRGKNSPTIRKILYNSLIVTNIYFLCYNFMGQKTLILRCLHDRSYGNKIFSQLASTLTQTLNVYTNVISGLVETQKWAVNLFWYVPRQNVKCKKQNKSIEACIFRKIHTYQNGADSTSNKMQSKLH